MPLQRNDKVRITQSGRYFNAEGHIVRRAAVDYAASIVAIRLPDGKLMNEIIPNACLVPVSR